MISRPAGKQQGRYVAAELPALPWPDDSFDLALCSHLLFLYSQQLDLEFHERSVLELCRIGREVRIFPLLALGGARSTHIEPIIECLRDSGHEVAIREVPYEFQRGGNQMMVIT
jgi:hypothetical protein